MKNLIVHCTAEAVTDRYGAAKTVIDGHEIEAKEQKWSYGLYSVLQFAFPKELRIERIGPNGQSLRAKIFGSEPTLIVMDGSSLPGEMYDLIPPIPPSEVKSVELIPFAKNFSQLYRDTYPMAHPLEIPTMGHVIAIYTHAGKGIFAANRTVGITKGVASVYSDMLPFPEVKHTLVPTNNETDKRQLIHWTPALRRTMAQEIKSNYYHSDQTGSFLYVIEGISSDGRAGYLEIPYRVFAEKSTEENR